MITFVDGKTEQEVFNTLKRYTKRYTGKTYVLCLANSNSKTFQSKVRLFLKQGMTVRIIADCDTFREAKSYQNFLTNLSFLNNHLLVSAITLILQQNLEDEMCFASNLTAAQLRKHFGVDGNQELKKRLGTLEANSLFTKLSVVNFDIFWSNKYHQLSKTQLDEILSFRKVSLG